MDPSAQLLRFTRLSERLKLELRHSWMSNGRRESVAEHTWHMALLAMLVDRHLEHPVDTERTLKMILVHDLVEAEAGDVPVFETGPRQDSKRERERAAMRRIRDLLDPETGAEISDLWYEFEDAETPEAKLVQALDHLEVQMQHNLADLGTWEEVEYDLVYTKMDRHCAHDRFLQQVSVVAFAVGAGEVDLPAHRLVAAVLRPGLGQRL